MLKLSFVVWKMISVCKYLLFIPFTNYKLFVDRKHTAFSGMKSLKKLVEAIYNSMINCFGAPSDNSLSYLLFQRFRAKFEYSLTFMLYVIDEQNYCPLSGAEPNENVPKQIPEDLHDRFEFAVSIFFKIIQLLIIIFRLHVLLNGTNSLMLMIGRTMKMMVVMKMKMKMAVVMIVMKTVMTMMVITTTLGTKVLNQIKWNGINIFSIFDLFKCNNITSSK